MSLLQNASPRLSLLGFEDVSGQTLPVVAEQLPVHLPLFFVFSSKGPTEPQLVSGATLTNTYGDDIINLRSKFATHVNPFVRAVNENANAMFIHRLKPADSKTASYRLWLDWVAATLPVYERDADGFYVRDVAGDLIDTGDTTSGYYGRWVVTEITSADGAIGAATPKAGAMTENSVQSQMYPICDLPASYFGKDGDNIGIRFWAPTTQGEDPTDEALALQQNAFIYRLQVMKRPDARSSANVWKTLSDANYVEFTLNPDSFNTRFDSELFADRVIQAAYRNMDLGVTGVPTYGPFGSVYFYHNNIATLSALVQARETLLNPDLPTADEGKYLINLFSAKNLNGAPYHSLALRGVLESGIELNETSTQYMTGGADGTITAASYETLVAEQLDNFGTLGTTYLDMARYPISAFYDSGFTLDVKKKIPKLLGARKDIHIALGTQDAALPLNSTAEDSAAAVALLAAARAYPESIVYGTNMCRAVIMGQAGYLTTNDWTRPVPATLELAIKRARYMGAGNGVFTGRNAYDVAPNNNVTYLKDLNNTWRSDTVRNSDWDVGLVSAMYGDRRTLFIPAFQTAYDDDTSVLNSDINMQIAVELNKVCFRVWRELVGNGKLTNAQFIQRSNELIVEYTKNRFDGRVVIVADTFYSRDDVTRGYSWHANIHMYANTLKTLGQSTIVTHRMSDLV